MNNNDKRDFSVTTFSTVVVRKDELLQTLEVNRNKHNSIYSAAVSGYWVESQKVLEKKKEEFSKAVAEVNRDFAKHQDQIETEFAYQASGIQGHIGAQDKDNMGKGFSFSKTFAYQLGFNTYWPLAYPENHLEDYDRVIDMLKFSVADKVELSSKDFDAYVRNNWSWRSSFLGTNTAYVTGAFFAISGCSSSIYASGGINCPIGVVSVTGGTYAQTLTQLNSAF